MLSSGLGEQVLSVKRDRSDLCILIGQFFSDYFIGYRYTKFYQFEKLFKMSKLFRKKPMTTYLLSFHKVVHEMLLKLFVSIVDT